MICFVDESWHDGPQEYIGVLAGAIGSESTFTKLGKRMYAIRRKYYGLDNARDMTKELRGQQLFSRNSFKCLQKAGHSTNLSVAREVLQVANDLGIKLSGITVYGSKRPHLLSPLAKKLERPFKELCIRVMSEISSNETGMLVFDQRIAAEQKISIAICNYIAGMPGKKKLRPQPFVGVSHVFPGLQLADIVAHILGKYATGDDRFVVWYRRLTPLQVEGRDQA